MNFDFNTFYAERIMRLNIPDEGLDEYINRAKASSKSQGIFLYSSNHSSQTRVPHGLARSSNLHQDQEHKSHSLCTSSVPQNESARQIRVQEAITSATLNAAQDRSLTREIAPGEHGEANRVAGVSNPLIEAQSFTFPNAEDTPDGITNMKRNDQNEEEQSSHYVDLPITGDMATYTGNRAPSANDDAVKSFGSAARPGQPTPAPTKSTHPPTSPIEDANDMTMAEVLRPHDKVLKGASKSARNRPRFGRKDQAIKRAAGKRGELIMLGSKVRPQSDAVSRRKHPSDVSSIIDDSSSCPSSPPLNVVAPSGTSAKVAISAGLNSGRTETGKSRAAGKKKIEKAKQMLPEEYAKTLMDRVRSELHPPMRKKYIQSLTGKNIFYAGGDMRYATERTRGRMDIIVRHGGNLVPNFDVSTVTHIVTDAQKGPTLRALGLKSLDIIPDHIPTVKWSWVVSCIGATLGNVADAGPGEIWLHAAFSERIDAGVHRVNPAPLKAKEKGNNSDAVNVSLISQFTQENTERQADAAGIEDITDYGGLPSEPAQLPALNSNRSRSPLPLIEPPDISHDPLKNFYAKARAELESERLCHLDGDHSGLESDFSDHESLPDMPFPKRGWTCDKREDKNPSCPNQDIIDKLQELMEIHKARPSEEDRWRAFSYSKCIRLLRTYPRRIKTVNEARSLRGVGEKTALKIMEIIETGQLRRIEYENTDDIKITRLFQGVYGAGPSVAYKWYAAGCRKLEDLLAGKGGVKLNSVQEIGVGFYSDINSRMPRDEAKAIFDLIKPVALQLDPKLFVEIMGSFRRGKTDCGDIDILITRPIDDGETHAGILPCLLRELYAKGILTEDLAIPEDPNDLEAIYRGLCRLPKGDSKRRRIDFLTVPWQSRGAALLYYTGDDIFNRAMRMKAKVMGYSLNQRGLFAGVVRDPHDWRIKTNPGQIIASETEDEIFRILEVPWQEPHERVRG